MNHSSWDLAFLIMLNAFILFIFQVGFRVIRNRKSAGSIPTISYNLSFFPCMCESGELFRNGTQTQCFPRGELSEAPWHSN